MDPYKNYTDWIIESINNQLALSKIKYIIFGFPSFDFFGTYIITNSREIPALKISNLMY
jgi:hypothetical protein